MILSSVGPYQNSKEIPWLSWLKGMGHKLGVLKGDFSNEDTDSVIVWEMQDYCEQDVTILARRIYGQDVVIKSHPI